MTATTLMLYPVAARALAVSWAASPATALKAIPVAAQPSPKAREPVAGNPPGASGASRPSLPPPSSSRRPLSSSLRVCRIVRMTMRTARMAVINAVYLISESAPMEVGS